MAFGPFTEDCSGNHSPPSELPSGQKSQQIPSWLRALIRCRRVCLRADIHIEIQDTDHGADRASITIQEKEAQMMIKSCSAACSPHLPMLMSNHLSTLQVLSIAMPYLTWTSFPPTSSLPLSSWVEGGKPEAA